MFRENNFINGRKRGGAFAATLVGIVAMLSSASTAALIMEYEQVLDIPASQERAIRPTAVSCDQLTGDVCVTDAQYSGFHVFNKYGVEVFQTGGASSLSLPVDGTLTPNGDFVFIDRDQNRVLTIRQLNFMGEPVEFTAEIPVKNWEPHHLALMRDGNILTLDSFNNILCKHDSHTGEILWLTDVTGDGSSDLQLGRPAEAPDGRIYVPSGILHSVFVFSEDGRRVEVFGEFGSGPGKLVFPVGVAIGPDESILVLDRMRHKILMFGPDRKVVSEFGSMGAEPGQFYHPTAIAATDDSRVYVAQGYDSRVQVFSIRNTKAE